MKDAAPESGIIDIDELMEVMDHDRDLIQECFRYFLAEWPVIFKKITAAGKAREAEHLNQAAHMLKGMLRYLCAHRAARAAMAVESAGRKMDMQDLDEKLFLLEQECLALIRYIESQV